jgi:hypothetical protein
MRAALLRQIFCMVQPTSCFCHSLHAVSTALPLAANLVMAVQANFDVADSGANRDGRLVVPCIMHPGLTKQAIHAANVVIANFVVARMTCCVKV